MAIARMGWSLAGRMSDVDAVEPSVEVRCLGTAMRLLRVSYRPAVAVEHGLPTARVV